MRRRTRGDIKQCNPFSFEEISSNPRRRCICPFEEIFKEKRCKRRNMREKEKIEILFH
jgi:hypothetical protein